MKAQEFTPLQQSTTPLVKLPNAVTQALGAKLRGYRELAQQSQETGEWPSQSIAAHTRYVVPLLGHHAGTTL